mgnify:CR=1 FL=1
MTGGSFALASVVLVTSLFVIFSNLVYALPVLNEVMPQGTEWIEVYNNSDASVELTTHKLFEADTNHKIISYQGGSNILGKDYAIISQNPEKFKGDFPNFTGSVFKSSFLL